MAGNPLNAKVVGRLSLYRRLVSGLIRRGTMAVYSHELASHAGVTAAQVRRDLMSIGFTATPSRGYDLTELARTLDRFLDSAAAEATVLIGVGNLGRAILAYFQGQGKLPIIAAFDTDPSKVGRMVHGCPCRPLAELSSVLAERRPRVAILTLPASEAQAIADQLIAGGVRGLVNFAPIPLRVPPGVHLESLDITMFLEKTAYFARLAVAREESHEHEGSR
ncbi:MAG: redox-sensing transcriptional repressor Rex [Candidatus Eisenbacteria bacterium]